MAGRSSAEPFSLTHLLIMLREFYPWGSIWTHAAPHLQPELKLSKRNLYLLSLSILSMGLLQRYNNALVFTKGSKHWNIYLQWSSKKGWASKQTGGCKYFNTWKEIWPSGMSVGWRRAHMAGQSTQLWERARCPYTITATFLMVIYGASAKQTTCKAPF